MFNCRFCKQKKFYNIKGFEKIGLQAGRGSIWGLFPLLLRDQKRDTSRGGNHFSGSPSCRICMSAIFVKNEKSYYFFHIETLSWGSSYLKIFSYCVFVVLTSHLAQQEDQKIFWQNFSPDWWDRSTRYKGYKGIWGNSHICVSIMPPIMLTWYKQTFSMSKGAHRNILHCSGILQYSHTY